MDPVGSPVRELSGTAAARVGRDGFLRLGFARRGPATVLVDRCYRTPLQVLEGLEFPGDPARGVVLLNPTGGVLGGDHLTTEMTPSATRIYGSRAEPSVVTTSVHLAADATLEYVPDHTILHPQARLRQTFEADLAPGARLLLWDAWALGRVARDEAWAFTSLASRVHVRVDGSPVYVDRLALEPRVRKLDRLGGTEGAGYVATWIAAGESGPRSWIDLASEWGDLAATVPGVSAAGSPLNRHGAVVRMLATSAYALLEAHRLLWDAARRGVLGHPPIDLRKA
jgi:urease accessory protein